MSTTVQQPSVTLSNGVEMPQFGLGTWKSEPGEVKNAVKAALKMGYRHVDCAMIYGNQKEVGEAIAESMKELNLKREDIFVTSKLWITHFKREHAKKAMDDVLSDLQLDHVDLFLLHWPISLAHVVKEDGSVDPMPKDEEGNLMLGYVPIADVWKTMEGFYEEGKTRAIGISNFEALQVVDLLATARVKPHMNQVEWHPYFSRYPLKRESERWAGMKMTAYSPFGNGLSSLWSDETLVAIAKKHNKSVAQIILRWILQNGVVVIPKSVHEGRLKENMEIFDFELGKDEMSSIDGLNKDLLTCSTRLYWGVDWIHLK